jgi:lipid-A-disaccharide synthase
VTAVAERKPDVFVALDFPDFNFRLLPKVHAAGVPIVYYVSPQVWAWRPRRLDTLRKYVTRTLLIFPFEQDIYERARIPAEFVGHPLVDLARASTPPDDWRRKQHLDLRQPLIALLPGSRPNELRRILPILARAIPAVARHIPGAQFVVARAPWLEDRLFAPLDPYRGAAKIAVRVADNATDDVLAAADMAVVASGTATVQTALHACPMVIVYRLAPLTYAVGKRVVTLSTFGMVNLVAGRPIVPELIQERLTPESVARELIALWNDPARREQMKHDLVDVRSKLGGGGASERAADAVLRVAGTERRLA